MIWLMTMFVAFHCDWCGFANAIFLQLFFLDSGVDGAAADVAAPSEMSSDSDSDDDDEETDQPPAVWHDSDDERLTVSLASQQRLRKLRVAESEDVINGKEYIRRLRRQYQQLHPTPEWANPELNVAQADSDSDRADDMDTDDEGQSSAQPLTKLLQGITDLTKLEDNTHTGGKRKLRPEMLDIQRLKDVGKDQPVSVGLY